MHDKYAYESIEMALHDKEVYRTLGCGMSGLSIAADSLAAIKYAKVYPIYNKDAKNLEGHEYEYVEGADDDLVVGYRTEGDFPVYGNDDDRADDIAKWVVSTVMGQVKRLPGLPWRRPDPVHPDHHLQRGVRQEHRFLPVRPHEGHSVRSGRQPGERHGLPRHAAVHVLRRQDRLQRRS